MKVQIAFGAWPPVAVAQLESLGILATMKRIKIPIVILTALVILALTYFVGYHVGRRADDRQHLRMNLLKDVYLYHEAESNGLATVKSSLGFFTFGDYDFYEKHYGGDGWSPVHMKAARQIAAFADTNDIGWAANGRQFMEEVLSTNRMPNTAPEPTSTAP